MSIYLDWVLSRSSDAVKAWVKGREIVAYDGRTIVVSDGKAVESLATRKFLPLDEGEIGNVVAPGKCDPNEFDAVFRIGTEEEVLAFRQRLLQAIQAEE